MSVVKKGLKSLKKHGLIKTIKRTIRFIKYKICTRKSLDFAKDYFDINKFDTIIVFENNFGWGKIMKQRPQQIAQSLPEGTLMLYHSHEDEDYKNKKRILKIKENLILIDLGYYREKLLQYLSFANNKYLMIYSTDYIPYTRIKNYVDYGYDIIYEYVDDFNEKLSGKDMYKKLVSRHKKVLIHDPYVVCTANQLYDNCIKNKIKDLSLITNGVDYNHFSVNPNIIPSDLVNIRNDYKYLICYYGALASWFDYELVNKIATKENYGVVLIGQDYDDTLEKSGILKNKNVFYLGKKDYNELPMYGYNCDVFIIPFLINDITKATSPVKIFEYMAMGKPIVTTALPECKKYKSVLYSNDHAEFIKNIDKAVELIGDKKYINLLHKEAKENTWESKATSIVQFVNESHYNKIALNLKKILNNEKYDRIVIWRSPFGWNVPLFQRPQHISNQLSKQKCLVFYEVTKNTDNVNDIIKIQDNLCLVNFENYVMKNIIREQLDKINKPKYIQIYSTNWSMSLDELKEYERNGYRVLYEYIDDISPDLAGTDEIPEYIIDKYNYAMKNKNVLVVTTAGELYNDVKNKRGIENLVLSCNGVDYLFYQKIDKKFKYEHDFLKIIDNGKVNICYYGALASWFDYELIKKINETDHFNIVLFGIKYDNSYDESGIARLKNVCFFGPKDYSVLKNYASKMDVLIIPFIINSITQATSPLKLFEYMALHKPIVTTAMNECEKYKSVQIGYDHEEFIKLLDSSINLINNKEYIELLDKEARENDWSQKAKIISELMKKNEGEKNGKN